MGTLNLRGRMVAYVLVLLSSLIAAGAGLAAGDKKPPTTPTTLSVSGVTTTGFSLNWAASTDNRKVAGYDLFLNGAAAGTSTTTSHAFTGLACGKSYTAV